jgi:hypothetical protein
MEARVCRIRRSGMDMHGVEMRSGWLKLEFPCASREIAVQITDLMNRRDQTGADQPQFAPAIPVPFMIEPLADSATRPPVQGTDARSAGTTGSHAAGAVPA